MNSFLKDNIVQIIMAIFLAGGLYSEFRMMKAKLDTVEARLDKKIKLINELDKRIDKLEK